MQMEGRGFIGFSVGSKATKLELAVTTLLEVSDVVDSERQIMSLDAKHCSKGKQLAFSA